LTNFCPCLATFFEGIAVLKDSIPLKWRPEYEMFGDPTENPCVFAFHLEYYVLHMQIFMARKAHAKMMTRYKRLRN